MAGCALCSGHGPEPRCLFPTRSMAWVEDDLTFWAGSNRKPWGSALEGLILTWFHWWTLIIRARKEAPYFCCWFCLFSLSFQRPLAYWAWGNLLHCYVCVAPKPDFLPTQPPDSFLKATVGLGWRAPFSSPRLRTCWQAFLSSLVGHRSILLWNELFESWGAYFLM